MLVRCGPFARRADHRTSQQGSEHSWLSPLLPAENKGAAATIARWSATTGRTRGASDIRPGNGGDPEASPEIEKVERQALPSAGWKLISPEHSPAGGGYTVTRQSLNEEYERVKHQCLVRAIEDIRAERRLSRRVVNVWTY